MATIRTVAGPGEAGLRTKGSRFLGRVAPVESREAAEAFVSGVAAEYTDATHVVPAYRVRAETLLAWSSDAGEPSGSAGTPILTVLERRALENVAVAVVRWYGGTKLGVAGLARAYARAAGTAIDDAGVVERHPTDLLHIRVEYDDSGTVRGLLEREDLSFEADYSTDVVFRAHVPAPDTDRLVDRVLDATRGRAAVERLSPESTD